MEIKVDHVCEVPSKGRHKDIGGSGSSGSLRTQEGRCGTEVTILISRPVVESRDLGQGGRLEFSRPRRIITRNKHRSSVGG